MPDDTQKFNPETQFTSDPVCPKCGYKHRDAWEWDFDSGDTEHDCGKCGEPFVCSRIVNVEYCTTPKTT